MAVNDHCFIHFSVAANLLDILRFFSYRQDRQYVKVDPGIITCCQLTKRRYS